MGQPSTDAAPFRFPWTRRPYVPRHGPRRAGPDARLARALPHTNDTEGRCRISAVLDLAPVYDREEQDFGWLEVALARAGFEPSADDGGWRWSTLMGDARIHLDVLCDVLDNPGRQLALPGTRTVTAMNVQGPVAALGDVARRPVSVRLDDTSPEVTLEIRYAGLGGYLLAKSAALVSRAASKDFYDLASARSSAPH